MAIIYLADLNISNNLGVPVTLNYSSGKTTTVGGIVYTAKISQPAFLGQSITIDSSIGGAISSSIGELILTNAKRDLDYLKTYIFEGKTLIVYSYDTVSLVKTKILTQVIEQATFEWTQVSIRIENKSASLDVPLQTKKYLGNNVLPNGTEGVIDLKDKLKPIIFGRVNNMTPILVNTSKLIYQISSEPVEQIVSVMTRGAYVSLADAVITSFEDFINETNSALYPPAGYYTFYSGAEGSFFRLGMASEVVTCTVWEKISAISNSPAQVIKRILAYAGITSYLATDITYIDAKVADNIGLFVDGTETVASLLTDICSSIGAWWGFDQNNNFRLYYFGDVSASTLATIHTKTDVDKYGITSFELTNATINGKSDPVKEVTLEYAKNYTVEDKGSIAGIITTTDIERATWLSEEFRKAKAVKDLTTIYPKSQILTYPTLFNSEYSAISEAQRVLALTSVKRNVISITARLPLSELIALYPCGIVNIVMPRYGFDSGKKCIIIGMELDFLNYTASLTLWGDVFDLQYPASLNLDFTSMNEILPSYVEYSRTGLATRTNKNGYLENVAANLPRFEYDAVNKYSKGVLVEKTRTNLLVNSYDFKNWGGITYILPRTQVDPFNQVRGCTLVDNSLISDQTYFNYDINITASTTNKYAISIFVKKGSADMIDLYTFFQGSITRGSRLRYIFSTDNLAGSAQDGAGVVPTGLINVKYPNGWIRIGCVVSDANSGLNTVLSFRIYPSSRDALVTGYTYMFGAQLEACGTSPSVSSYIPQTEVFTSRAGNIGSYFNSSGLLVNAATNVARYSYNPNDLTIPPALIVENTATNSLKYSQQFSTASYWLTASSNMVTVEENTSIAPNGNMEADKLIIQASTGFARLSSPAGLAGTLGNVWTGSVYIKPAEISLVSLRVGRNATSESATFNLATQTVDRKGSSVLYADIIPIGNNWFRIFAMVTLVETNANQYFVIGLNDGDSLNVTGDGTSGLYVWGAQLEPNSISSYIPTTTIAVTRSADIYTSTNVARGIEGYKISSTYFGTMFNPLEGTLTTTCTFNPSDNIFCTPLSLSSTNSAKLDYIAFRTGSGGTLTYTVVTDNATTAVNTLTASFPYNLTVSMSASYKVDSFASSYNGGTVTTDTLGVVPTLGVMTIGAAWDITNQKIASDTLNGCVLKAAYYPTQITTDLPNLSKVI